MSPQPTTSRLLGSRRNRTPLAERFRVWRSRPRIASPRLYCGVLGLAILLDAAALTLGLCMLLSEAAPAAGVLRLGSWCPAWAVALAATILFAMRAWSAARRSGAARVLAGMGLAVGAVVAIGAGWPSATRGLAGWANWGAGLVLLVAILLEAGSARGILALSGAAVATVGFLVAAGLPATESLPSPREVLGDNPITAVRTIAVAGGAAAGALAWAAANVALGMVIATPTRRGSIRVVASAAYRALGVAVLLLTGAALVGGWPHIPREIVFLTILTVMVLLLHARFAGWLQDLGLVMGCSLLGVLLLVASGEWILQAGFSPLVLGWLWFAALANGSLIIHALHRYCFGAPGKIRA
jgi:hypothetical protein